MTADATALMPGATALTGDARTLFEAVCAAPEPAGPHPWIEDTGGGTGRTAFLRQTLGVARLCRRFSARGDTVGVLLPNATATAAVILGLTAAGRVPAMLNYTAGAATLRQSLAAAGARTLLASRRFVEQAGLAPLLEGGLGVEVVWLEDLRRTLTLADRLWILLAVRRPRSRLPQPNPEDTAVILFTSGSEGTPKGVALSHRAILANIRQLLTLLPINAGDRMFCNLPVYHSFGLVVGLLTPLTRGFPVYLYPSPLHYQTIPGRIRATGATVLLSTNTFLLNYARHAAADDFRTLRYVVAGAEKLKAEVAATWAQRFGIRILEGYGFTECAPVVACNVPGAERPGTVGRIVPDLEIRFEPVPGIAHRGVLHVRGPNLMSGYLLAEAPGRLTMPPSPFGPGWYCSGDIADLDAEGHLVLHGRLKRFAKVAGEMVSLEAVEKLAYGLSPEQLHAAVALPDAARGERIALLTADAAVTRERLLEAIRRNELGVQHLPRLVLCVDTVPVLGAGKPDYAACARLAAQTD